MKKIIIATLAFAMLLGCKKGENDPGISFRSRDARVVGEWKVANYEINSESDFLGNITKNKEKFDGSKIVKEASLNGNPTNPPVDNNTYSYKINIMKDGNVAIEDVTTSSVGLVTTKKSNGTWSWADSKKNKSRLQISVSGFANGIFDIDQLKNKELILKSSSSTSTVSSSPTQQRIANSSSRTLTLTQ